MGSAIDPDKDPRDVPLPARKLAVEAWWEETGTDEVSFEQAKKKCFLDDAFPDPV